MLKLFKVNQDVIIRFSLYILDIFFNLAFLHPEYHGFLASLLFPVLRLSGMVYCIMAALNLICALISLLFSI